MQYPQILWPNSSGNFAAHFMQKALFHGNMAIHCAQSENVLLLGKWHKWHMLVNKAWRIDNNCLRFNIKTLK